MCEALQAKRVYWAEREFDQFLEPLAGEQVVLVDTRSVQGRGVAQGVGAARSETLTNR